MRTTTRCLLGCDGASIAVGNWYAYGLGPDEVPNQMNAASVSRPNRRRPSKPSRRSKIARCPTSDSWLRLSLPRDAVALLDELKVRQGTRNRSQALMQLIGQKGAPDQQMT
jgi:hypothetical protein